MKQLKLLFITTLCVGLTLHTKINTSSVSLDQSLTEGEIMANQALAAAQIEADAKAALDNAVQQLALQTTEMRKADLSRKETAKVASSKKQSLKNAITAKKLALKNAAASRKAAYKNAANAKRIAEKNAIAAKTAVEKKAAAQLLAKTKQLEALEAEVVAEKAAQNAASHGVA